MKQNVEGWDWNIKSIKKIQNKIKNNQKNKDQIWYNEQITWYLSNFAS